MLAKLAKRCEMERKEFLLAAPWALPSVLFLAASVYELLKTFETPEHALRSSPTSGATLGSSLAQMFSFLLGSRFSLEVHGQQSTCDQAHAHGRHLPGDPAHEAGA